MAAVMPMRYGSGACAGTGRAAMSVSTPAAAMRTRPRMSSLLLCFLCDRGHLGGDPPLFVRAEHRFDEVPIALEHQPALHLACGRDGLTLLLGIQLARQEAKGLHLLDASERGVGPRDLAVEQARHLGMRRKRRVTAVGEAAAPSPLGDGLVVHLDQSREVLAPLPEHDGVAHVWARAQDGLDLSRADVLTARGNDEILPAVDEANGARGRALRHVSGEEPSVTEGARGRLGIAPVPGEEIGATHAQLAVDVDRELDVGCGHADVTRTRVGSELARHERPARFGLAVGLAE